MTRRPSRANAGRKVSGSANRSELAATVAQLAKAVTTAREGIPDAADSSPAHLACLTHPELSGELLSLPDAYRQAVMHIVQAEDHCRGLADLIRARRSFACDAVARSLTENSVRAWFLLEPNIDAAERVRRLLNERLWATHEYTEWMGKLANRDPAGVRSATELRDRLMKQCEEAGYEITGARRGRYVPHIGDRRPGLASLLDRMLHQPGVNEDISGDGAAFYAQLSAVAHGGMHGFVQRLELIFETGAPPRGALHELSPGEVVDALAIAPLAFCIAAALCAEQMGWPTARLIRARADWIRVWSVATR